MLMIVPLMIWSARTEIDNQAWSAEIRTPARIAASSAKASVGVIPNAMLGLEPRIGPANTPAYQPTKAALIMIPSIPMLTTPERSHSTAQRAARAMGVAAWRMNGEIVG